MDERVLLDVADGVAAITLNGARNGNAIDLTLARALMETLHACEGNAAVRAITLKGAGKIFCAGGDLAAIHGAAEGSPAYVRHLLSFLHEAHSVIARIPVPVVAGVHGAAAGAGLPLAVCCDLVVAAQSTRFVMAYSRVGVTPDGASSWYLPRLVGLRRALELALTNRELSASEARDWGLVNEVVPDDAVFTRLGALARSLADGPARAFGETKRLLRKSLASDLEAQLADEGVTICAQFATGEAQEGLRAFLEKRPAAFRRES